MQLISRSEAKTKNLKRYFTGEKCKRGHVSERKISNGTCVDCASLYNRTKRSTAYQQVKDRSYRSTNEYKSRKNYNKRVSNHVDIINARLKLDKDRCRAGGKYISKVEAVEHGLTRYFNGSICKRNHVAERLVVNNNCVDCSLYKASKVEAIKAKSKYYSNNKERLVARNIERQRERYAESPEYKASTACRNMLKRVLRKAKTKKNGGSYELLGYDRDQLMSHIESLFTDGMTWDNYGEWHIDHIVPVSWWFENGVNDPSMINALINLQPLWAIDNLTKSNKFVN